MSRLAPRIAPVALSFLVVALVLAACGDATASPQPSHTPAPETPQPTPAAPTPTPVEPTPTPIPLAAVVNGEPVSLADFQAELARFEAAQQALGTNLATDSARHVLDDMIDQLLLAQAAREAGFVLDEAAFQARLDELAQQAGGSAALLSWMQTQGYTEPGFRAALSTAIAAAWMRDQIGGSLPETAEQVHARQILLYNFDQANQVLAQLQSGRDFNDLAARYDPLASGDLGWFPWGYLAERELEEAAFALEPGAYSAIIQTRLGYHILLVVERDERRLLSADARLVLQTHALQEWLEQRRDQSEIQILLP